MTYSLGIAPDSLTLNLYADAPFDAALTQAGGWGGKAVTLRFPIAGVTWTAVVIGDTATFSESASVVNARANNEAVELRVGDACWATGRTVFRGR